MGNKTNKSKLIGTAVVLLLAVGLAVYFLAFNKPNNPAAPTATPAAAATDGDLPAPQNATKLSITLTDFQKFSAGNAPLNPNAPKPNFAGYASGDAPDKIATYYRGELKNRGWAEDASASSASGLFFKKGDNSAGITYLPLQTQDQVTTLGQVFPTIKDQLKVGQTVVFLLSGPSSVVAPPRK